MENVKLNVRALAANEKMSIEDLAEKCGIEPSHLRNVSAGRATMTAEDIVKLSAYTGINCHNIQY